MLSSITVLFTYCNFRVKKEKQSVPDERPAVLQFFFDIFLAHEQGSETK